MTSVQDILFQPIQMGPNTLKNRVFLSPLTRSRSVPTNVPNTVNVEYYRQRAKGGAGFIVSEGALITRQGTEWQNAPGIWNDEQVNGWKQVTEAVHEEGTVIFCQLWHLGRVSHPEAPEQLAAGTPVYAPSAIAARGGKFRFLLGQPGYVTPTVIDDPWKLVALFKKAAINAKDAGFDGVEILASNGYLIPQFLDITSNRRTDEWGGSVENRSRFGLEVLKAVIEIWGSDRVGIKLMPAGGGNDIAMPLEETLATFKYFLGEADKLLIAYFVLYRYTEVNNDFITQERTTPHDVIATYGPIIKNALVFARPPRTSRLQDGVLFGVPWIAHPDLALRIKYNKPLDNVFDKEHLYGSGGSLEAQKKGYTDYPFASYN
ncbi:hypothetical protein CPB85DRAFT_1488169 [Mucidula mucida]|nr:hypothetical protein CPB85DRAFT_1488169 [Mucidula mucida]